MAKPNQESNPKRFPEVPRTVRFKIARWLLVTIDSALLIFYLTASYAAFLVGDTLILALITWSFGDIARQSTFAGELLRGIRLLSALGIASAYALHLIYSIYRQGKHVARMIQKAEKKEEEP